MPQCHSSYPCHHFKDICERNMRVIVMDIERWEIVNNNHKRWKHNLYWGLEQREQKRRLSAGKKHSRQKENHEGTSAGGGIFICIHCSQDCHSCWWWWSICCGCTSHSGCCIAISKWSITVWVQIQGFYRPTDATHTCIRLVETYCILYMSVVLHSFRHF